MNQNIPTEQEAFEEWLNMNRPSGDVEQVQRQWYESSDYADFLFIKLTESKS